MQEASRLKRALAMLMEEAGKRTSQEVATVREECGRDIDKMAVEIEKLERVSRGILLCELCLPVISQATQHLRAQC